MHFKVESPPVGATPGDEPATNVEKSLVDRLSWSEETLEPAALSNQREQLRGETHMVFAVS